jgi:hypothetical protein
MAFALGTVSAGFTLRRMDRFSSKWRFLTIGCLSLAVLSAPVFDATGQSQPLYPALDGNHPAKALHRKAYRRRVALQGVNLAWAPSPSSPNIDGYRIYYGTSSRNYSEHLDVGMVTSAKVPKATNGGSYFYVVVAYKGALESPPSNEVATASARSTPVPTLIATDTPSPDGNPTPKPSPESGTTPASPASVPASAAESTQSLMASDAAPAATPTLRFQRRLQRLGLPQSKGSNPHEGAGAAAAEPAPK